MNFFGIDNVDAVERDGVCEAVLRLELDHDLNIRHLEVNWGSFHNFNSIETNHF